MSLEQKLLRNEGIQTVTDTISFLKSLSLLNRQEMKSNETTGSYDHYSLFRKTKGRIKSLRFRDYVGDYQFENLKSKFVSRINDEDEIILENFTITYLDSLLDKGDTTVISVFEEFQQFFIDNFYDYNNYINTIQGRPHIFSDDDKDKSYIEYITDLMKIIDFDCLDKNNMQWYRPIMRHFEESKVNGILHNRLNIYHALNMIYKLLVSTAENSTYRENLDYFEIDDDGNLERKTYSVQVNNIRDYCDIQRDFFDVYGNIRNNEFINVEHGIMFRYPGVIAHLKVEDEFSLLYDFTTEKVISDQPLYLPIFKKGVTEYEKLRYKFFSYMFKQEIGYFNGDINEGYDSWDDDAWEIINPAAFCEFPFITYNEPVALVEEVNIYGYRDTFEVLFYGESPYFHDIICAYALFLAPPVIDPEFGAIYPAWDNPLTTFKPVPPMELIPENKHYMYVNPRDALFTDMYYDLDENLNKINRYIETSKYIYTNELVKRTLNYYNDTPELEFLTNYGRATLVYSDVGDIYTKARMGKQFDILRWDTSFIQPIELQMFEYNYVKIQTYFNKVKYNQELENQWAHYPNFMANALIYAVFGMMCNIKLEKYSKKIYTEEEMNNILIDNNFATLVTLSYPVKAMLIDQLDSFKSMNASSDILQYIMELVTSTSDFSKLYINSYKLVKRFRIEDNQFFANNDIYSDTELYFIKKNTTSNSSDTSVDVSSNKPIKTYEELTENDKNWAASGVFTNPEHKREVLAALKKSILESPFNEFDTKYMNITNLIGVAELADREINKLALLYQINGNMNTFYDTGETPFLFEHISVNTFDLLNATMYLNKIFKYITSEHDTDILRYIQYGEMGIPDTDYSGYMKYFHSYYYYGTEKITVKGCCKGWYLLPQEERTGDTREVMVIDMTKEDIDDMFIDDTQTLSIREVLGVRYYNTKLMRHIMYTYIPKKDVEHDPQADKKVLGSKWYNGYIEFNRELTKEQMYAVILESFDDDVDGMYTKFANLNLFSKECVNYTEAKAWATLKRFYTMDKTELSYEFKQLIVNETVNSYLEYLRKYNVTLYNYVQTTANPQKVAIGDYVYEDIVKLYTKVFNAFLNAVALKTNSPVYDRFFEAEENNVRDLSLLINNFMSIYVELTKTDTVMSMSSDKLGDNSITIQDDLIHTSEDIYLDMLIDIRDDAIESRVVALSGNISTVDFLIEVEE